MTARLEISSAVPAEIAERDSDVLDWPTESEMREIHAQQDADVRAMLVSLEWWKESLQGFNSATDALPAILARVMANLDNACSGDEIGHTAILTALSQLRREARAMARKEVEL